MAKGRPLYDVDDDEENSPYVSQAARKKFKSEAPEIDSSSSVEQSDDSAEAACEDEDGDEDEDDGCYSEKKEAFPSHPAFDKRIPKLKKMLAEIAEDALDSVNRTTCDTDEVNELRSRAQKASIMPQHDRPMIGFVGDAGEGWLVMPLQDLTITDNNQGRVRWSILFAIVETWPRQ